MNITERAGERRTRKERERNKNMNEKLRENLTMNGAQVLFSNLKGYVEWQVEEQSNGREAVEKIKLISVSDKTSSKMNGTLCEFECYRKDGSLALYVSMDERGLLKGMYYALQSNRGLALSTFPISEFNGFLDEEAEDEVLLFAAALAAWSTHCDEHDNVIC